MAILDNLDPKNNIIIAEKNKRLMNYLIDQVSIFIYILYFVLFIYDPGSLYVAYFLVSCPYYFFMEQFNDGKTMGKIVTKTKAVTIDGEKMTLITVLIRTIGRLIPFDNLSYIFMKNDGLHDMISKTVVINDENSL